MTIEITLSLLVVCEYERPLRSWLTYLLSNQRTVTVLYSTRVEAGPVWPGTCTVRCLLPTVAKVRQFHPRDQTPLLRVTVTKVSGLIVATMGSPIKRSPTENNFNYVSRMDFKEPFQSPAAQGHLISASMMFLRRESIINYDIIYF